MANGQFVTVKLMRGGSDTPWGFRLQGGLEFGMPLSVVKIAPGSLADQSGVQVGDILLKINNKECDNLRHKQAQDNIVSAGNYLELYLERGPMNTWKPSVTPVGAPTPASNQQLYTRTSLAKSPEANVPIGSGHNTAAKPFSVQSKPALVHKQYNSPVNLYSEKNIEETLSAHTQVLATGATGINFMRPDAPVNKESAVYQMVLEEEERKSKGLSGSPDLRKNGFHEQSNGGGGGVIQHVNAPSGKPGAALPETPNRNICAECERLIVGVFVRINNKSLHAECFRCATCGTLLKNAGYFNINDKLYCDIHARQIKAVLGVNASLGPTVAASEGSTYTNGHANGAANGATNGYGSGQGTNGVSYQSPPPPQSAPNPMPEPMSYQPPPPAQANTTQNGYQPSNLRKYSPVAPPTAPKPNMANRNSMYVNSPTSYSVETHSTSVKNDVPNSAWPPSTNGNSVTYRQTTTQHTERPKSCFNLPSYSVTTNTYTTTTNYAPPNNANANYPKAATYASQTTTQKVIAPPAPLPVSNVSNQFAPKNLTGGLSSNGGSRPWTSSSFGKSAVPGAPSAPRRGRGLLQTQLSGGVIPFCGYCSQPIRGQYIMALNKTWCPNHFVCANNLCKRSLEQNGFVEEGNRLYCESCYETHFAPACNKCQQRIKGDCLNALDKQWHPNCFTCSYCKNPFGNSSFYLEDGYPYCEKDWNDLFTTKCVGCNFPIAAGDRWVEALSQNWHSNCFKCTVCRSDLEGQSFFAKGGRPFCRAHAR